MDHDDHNLIYTTRRAFDEIAPQYLREDKHWGCDMDLICEYVEKFENPMVIDLGTGHAWHIMSMFFLCSTKLEWSVGIDFSDNMIKEARKMLSLVRYKGGPLSDKVRLLKADILSIPFQSEVFDVVLMLNNTLGNLPSHSFVKAKENRIRALQEVRRILRESGYVIISVYNADTLTEKDNYGDVFMLDFKQSNLETFDLIVRLKETATPYYSHWFTQKELCKLLESAGLEIVDLEKRKKRIIVVGKK